MWHHVATNMPQLVGQPDNTTYLVSPAPIGARCCRQSLEQKPGSYIIRKHLEPFGSKHKVGAGKMTYEHRALESNMLINAQHDPA